jgi:hypothetical protein
MKHTHLYIKELIKIEKMAKTVYKKKTQGIVYYSNILSKLNNLTVLSMQINDLFFFF